MYWKVYPTRMRLFARFARKDLFGIFSDERRLSFMAVGCEKVRYSVILGRVLSTHTGYLYVYN
jgi:hypothetical protein